MDSLTASFTVCPCTTGDCPCACNKGAPVKEPPTRSRRPEEDEWAKKDPWSRAPRRGDDGDGDDGDGGDEGDDADDGFFIGTPGGRAGSRGPKKAHEYEYGKLFEAKDAKFLPEYNGKEKGGLWRRKVSYYLISKYPDMEFLLEWVEQQKEVVNPKLLRNFKKIDLVDSVALGKHLWGFLNISLSGDA